jgi:hypothetical protein
MCFSATASFAGAALLATLGGWTLKKTSNRTATFLAAIPILFAIQQFSEGIVWLYLSHQNMSPILYSIAMNVFLFFAFLVWPVWIPLSIASVEPIAWRRWMVAFILACGIALACINLIYGWGQRIDAAIVHHSIQYNGRAPEQAFAYPLIILLPCFMSSLKKVWIFGVLILFGYIFADYSYTSNFVSVWCFFAALTSLLLYKVLQENQMLD